jgi:hypothetical protein
MRHYLTHAARWIQGIFGTPTTDSREETTAIPPPPVKNDIDPENDPALAEMGESLEQLDWRREQLRRERRVLRRGRE